MFKEIVDDGRRTTDIERSQKLTMSTSCSGELKNGSRLGHKSDIVMVFLHCTFPQCVLSVFEVSS